MRSVPLLLAFITGAASQSALVGEACTAAYDCDLGGRCVQGICVPVPLPNSGFCAILGEYCTADYDCCEDSNVPITCGAGRCVRAVAPVDPVPCNNVGVGCSSTVDCCGGAFGNYCDPDSSLCVESAPEDHQHIVLENYTCKVWGEECHADVHCCGQGIISYCSAGQCVPYLQNEGKQGIKNIFHGFDDLCHVFILSLPEEYGFYAVSEIADGFLQSLTYLSQALLPNLQGADGDLFAAWAAEHLGSPGAILNFQDSLNFVGFVTDSLVQAYNAPRGSDEQLGALSSLADFIADNSGAAEFFCTEIAPLYCAKEEDSCTADYDCCPNSHLWCSSGVCVPAPVNDGIVESCSPLGAPCNANHNCCGDAGWCSSGFCVDQSTSSAPSLGSPSDGPSVSGSDSQTANLNEVVATNNASTGSSATVPILIAVGVLAVVVVSVMTVYGLRSKKLAVATDATPAVTAPAATPAITKIADGGVDAVSTASTKQ